MAITKREYDIAAFWNSNTVLDVLQTALAEVGFHAPAQTGTILTFTNTAGTTLSGAIGRRFLVKQSATSGSGVNCTFDVLRNSTGAISTVTLVRGGKNYANTNTITIPGANIGGTTPTDNITITVSTVSGSQGSTTTYYDKDTATPYTFGVCCVNNDEAKKMGQTFYSFHIAADPSLNPTLSIKSGAGFQSTTNVFTGVANLDFINSAPTNSSPVVAQVFARSNTTPIRLITFQSAIDPNFVVFQFCDVLEYGDIFRDPFVLSKYNTATQPWDLDDCFTGAVYGISYSPSSNTVESNIGFSTTGLALPKRCGEWGYAGYAVGGTGARSITGIYESIFGRRLLGGSTSITTSFPVIYQRTVMDLATSSLKYNPVITGIPIVHTMVPVPYFIPADFGITEVIGTNTISHKHVVAVGATQQWRVIQFGNNVNATTFNSAIAFVGKIVD